MPYSGSSDPNIPDHVPASKKKQWVEVFNSTYSSCIDKGGKAETCETKAFKIANGVVKKTKRGDVMTLEGIVTNLKNLVASLLTGLSSIDRSLSISHIYQQISGATEYNDKRGYLVDIYRGTTGDLFALFNNYGKLSTQPVTFTDGAAELSGEPTLVEIEFQPIARSFQIVRKADSPVRWISTSCTSVVNRVGEIDSTELFDSFVDHVERGGDYPVRWFFHKGEQFRTGQCDFVAREGNVLITSGIYDDSELAQQEIKAREADPEYWADSIGYDPTAEPELLEISGISIPVYKSGILEEISTLPTQRSAAFYTNRTRTLEVKRAMNKVEMEALVRLFDGDEAKARKWLETNVDEVNRTIADSGAITRATGDSIEQSTETPVEEAEQTPQEVVLEDAAVEKIAAAVIANPTLSSTIQKLLEPFTNLVTQFAQLTTEVTELRAAQTRAMKTVEDRVIVLEKDDEAKKRQWLEDSPRSAPSSLRVTYRPTRSVQTPAPGTEEDPEDLSKIAEATLANIK